MAHAPISIPLHDAFLAGGIRALVVQLLDGLDARFAFSRPIGRINRLLAGTLRKFVSVDKACALMKAGTQEMICDGVGVFFEAAAVLVDLPCAEARAFLLPLQPWHDLTGLATLTLATIPINVWRRTGSNPSPDSQDQGVRLPDSLLKDGWWLERPNPKRKQNAHEQIDRSSNMTIATLGFLFHSRILHFVLMLVLFFCLETNAVVRPDDRGAKTTASAIGAILFNLYRPQSDIVAETEAETAI